MSVATVDERIAGLEHRRATETLTLKEEKEVMAEIKALRASRAGIAGYDQNFKELEGQREKNNSSRKEIKAQMDELDKEIAGVMLPSVVNLAVIPLVGAVDTLWIGRMGSALALAGQGAANQCFFSTFFLIAFIPTITAPLVAKSAGAGDIAGACKRVCEALFLANVLGAVLRC